MSWTDGAESACRDFIVDGEGNVCRATGYMTDCLSEDTDKVPLQTHTLKEFEQHLNDLKKENFSLKLRIYFLEERIQQKFEDGGDDVYRTNIELKVEVESLKQELQEKQQLLDKALTTAESLTNHNEAELQRHCEERQQEIDHMQQVLESKIQILQEEAQIARDEAERMASLDESHSQHPSVAMETVPKETSGDWTPQSDEDADRDRIEQLSAALCCKERLIRELTEERTDLRQRVRHMEEQLQKLSVSLLQRERDAQIYEEELGRERLRVQQEMQTLMEEQTQTLQFDHSAGQCVAQLQNAQMQVEALQTQIHHSETSNKKLQKKVIEMESELLSISQAAQNQQRTIQNLTDSLRTKDTEALDGTVDSSSLFSCQLEAHHTHTHTLTQRRLEDLKRSRDRLQDELRDAEEHREITHTHNKDLCETLERLRSELRVKVCELRDREAETHSDISDRDETITQLQKSLCRKHTLLQEYSELLNSSGASERDTLLHTLRSRIRDRDAALERSIDEKFLCLEEKDAEVHRLQLMLREKDRDLERLRCVLNNTNDTVTGLDALVRSKELELERTLETCRKLEWMKQQSDEKHTIAVRERDGVIQRLQTALHTHSKEAEELRSVLLGKLSATDVLQELQARLSTRERLFQEVMSEHSLQLQEHHTHLTELLDTISSRDQEMKDYGERLGRVISERSAQLQELRRLLSSREQELHDVNRERERDFPAARELKRLQNVLKEKDSLIQELLQGQSSTAAERAVCTSSSGDLEIQAIRDELQLTLRKQRETEREVSELRSLLAARHHDTLRSDQQCVLQQLVSEQKALNEALRAEKSLYQSLRGVQSPADSSAEKTRALDEQLNSLQALRELLGHTLETSRHTALAMERHTLETDRATRVQDDYGESSSDEDDEDLDSSDEDEEFTDSIEDNDITLTAQSLTSAQRAEEGGRPLMSHNASEGVRCDEVERNQDECKVVEVPVQAEDSSLTHVRNTPEKHLALDHSESGSAVKEEVCVRSRGLEECEADRRNSHEPQRDYRTCSEEEEDESDEEDGEEEVRVPLGKRGPPCVKLRESRRKRRCTRPHSLDLGALLSHTPAAQDEEREVEGDSNELSDRGGGAVGFWQHVEAGLREQAERLRSDLAVSRQESRELQERLMVSEATVHAQAEQLNDYRELLTESAVQRDSKQVQVDLQDLGYETSGRSENEAEREEASSPEFDELEMCGSLSVTGNQRCGWHGDNDAAQTDDPSSLKCLVQDLRAQLSRCHKVIRGLQLRMRSFSTTSDYASSLERTPRKVNWAFEALEEDEGWQSDGPLRPSREMQALVTRVALLETQIRSKSQEEGRCATWPGKYNTLIQAQARELSHLRQKMREGRGICHILTQHLSDTTKAFEELLRANDIDYYMSQSFREQLSQSSSLAQRVSTKISGRDRSEQRDDKAGHELLALRLSKELQHKDQIIESLHTQLQKRSDTPCSSHAPSETTDQSDCISFVSDERGSTNEELCSDSEFAPETEPETKDGVFSAPHSLSSYQLAAHMPVSHHALGNSEGPSVQTDALWDMENMIQPIRGFNGSSYYQSGNSQSGVDVIEEHLREIRSLRQRLEDSIRTNERLRQQLQGRLSTVRDTAAPTNIFIQSHGTVSQLTNEIRALKEENLALQSRIQASRDSSEEVKQLREAVLSGRVRLQQAELEAELEAGQWKEELRRLQMHNCEQSLQIQQLRQDRQNSQEHNNRLQHEVSLLQQQLAESRQLLHSLQSELQLYNQVCVGGKGTAAGCVCEVPCPSVELQELLVEVRALRVQLEVSVQENSSLRAQLQKLDHSSDQRRSPIVPASPLRDVLYRRLILHDPSPSPPVRDVGPFPAGPLYSPYSEMEETNDSLEPQADLEGEAPDGSFAHSNGRHAVGHVDDHGSLQQQVLEARVLVQRMEAALTESLDSALMEKALDYSTVKALLSDTKTLHQILDEAVSLLKMFWRAALPSSDGPVHLLQREQSMREEIQFLRLRIAQQEEVLQGTITRLRSTSRTKESMETFIVNQLSRTRDVLKKARANLEKNELRISSLSSSSSSLCHGKASSSSSSSARVNPACPETSLQRPAQRVREFLPLNQRHR